MESFLQDLYLNKNVADLESKFMDYMYTYVDGHPSVKEKMEELTRLNNAIEDQKNFYSKYFEK